MYPVLAERSFVSCSFIMWSWLMLCSAAADLLGCAGLTRAVFFSTSDRASKEVRNTWESDLRVA